MSRKQIRLQVPPKLFRVNSWIAQSIVNCTILNRKLKQKQTSILSADLLNTSAERLGHVDRLRDLVEVPVTSDEKVKGQGQLREGATRHAVNGLLIIDFEKAVSLSPRELDRVPLIKRDLLTTPATTCEPLWVYFATCKSAA